MLESARDGLSQVQELISSPSPDTKEQVGQIARTLKETLENGFSRAIASDYLDSFIFGVNPDSIATALVLLALDEREDLFLDHETYSETYPRSEWARLFGGLPIDLHGRPDPNQLVLFDDQDERVNVTLKMGLWELKTSGPVPSAWGEVC